jgi:predicted DNA binding protein
VQSLDVVLRQPDDMLHPMQAFIRHEDAVRYEELLTWTVLPDRGLEYELFYVEADRERYRERVDAVDGVREYTIWPVDDDSFYVYACQETRPEEVAFRGAFADLGLVVVPPIVYTDEAAMQLTVVGDGEDLRTMLASLPAGIDAEVLGIGEFDRRRDHVAGGLTARQREAVAAALDLGYYAVPRETSLAAVASALDCAESTASILLRRAEAAVMARAVGGA